MKVLFILLVSAWSTSASLDEKSELYMEYKSLLAKYSTKNDIPLNCSAGSGLACKDCTKLVMCRGTEEITIATCTNGQNCLSGTCSANGNSICNPYPATLSFPCSVNGIFAHPGDCKKYYICNDKCKGATTGDWTGWEVTCENSDNYGFDAATRSCSKPLTDKKCPAGSILYCTEGDNQPKKIAKSLYYICAKYKNILYPYQMSCPNGKDFDDNTKSCPV